MSRASPPLDVRHAGAFAARALLAAALWLAASHALAQPRAPTVGARYPTGRTHSPLTPAVLARLRAQLERGDLRPDAFAKIGASATVNRNYLHCFDGDAVRLGEHEGLRETLRFFARPAEGPRSFSRRSQAAEVGWHAGRAIWGNPPPAVREVRDIDPRFALVMYGTNDIELGRPHLYATLMDRLVRALTVRGVIPLVSTIMPRDDDPEADRWVPLYNAVLRGLAQMHQIPLVDFHRELAPLPRHGLARDGVHPRALFVDGHATPCDLTERGLAHGYNVRNLLALQTLDRMRRHVLEGAPADDAAAPPLAGAGSFADPLRIDALPFAHASDTSRSPFSQRDSYGCGTQDESGPEVVYRLDLDEPATVHAVLLETHGVDVDLHVLREGECVARGDRQLTVELEPGTHQLAVDSFTDPRGRARAGTYLLALARIDRPSVPVNATGEATGR